MERTTYSYLILSSLQITRCSRIQPTSMHRTYMVIMNAEPMNCCKSTAKPMVDRKVREINRPRSRLPRSFCTGLSCATQIETVVRSSSLPAFWEYCLRKSSSNECNTKTDGQQPCNITDRPFFIGHQRLFIALFQLFFAELVWPELVPFFGCLHQHWSCKQEYHQWGGNNIVCCICSCQCFSRTIQTGCNSSQVWSTASVGSYEHSGTFPALYNSWSKENTQNNCDQTNRADCRNQCQNRLFCQFFNSVRFILSIQIEIDSGTQ